MSGTDLYTIFLLHVTLSLFTLFAVFRDTRNCIRKQKAEVTGEVTRGEKSMTTLYAVYGASIAACLTLINSASGIDGHKVALIVLDFLSVTYLFFFNSWFRNSVFFHLVIRISKD